MEIHDFGMDIPQPPREEDIQHRAEAHLESCYELLAHIEECGPTEDTSDCDHELGEHTPAAPFDGCTTCVVREVLEAVWDDFLALARAEIAQTN